MHKHSFGAIFGSHFHFLVLIKNLQSYNDIMVKIVGYVLTMNLVLAL